MDRAPDFESVGCAFESRRGRRMRRGSSCEEPLRYRDGVKVSAVREDPALHHGGALRGFADPVHRKLRANSALCTMPIASTRVPIVTRALTTGLDLSQSSSRERQLEQRSRPTRHGDPNLRYMQKQPTWGGKSGEGDIVQSPGKQPIVEQSTCCRVPPSHQTAISPMHAPVEVMLPQFPPPPDEDVGVNS